MKLVTFILNDCERVGSLDGERVIDLREARAVQLLSKGSSAEKASKRSSREIPDSMVPFIEGGEETLSIARESQEYALRNEGIGKTVYSLKDLKLKAPIPRPPMILIMGNAYRPSKMHGFFFKPVTAVIGPDEPIVIPKESTDFGTVFEPEIGVIIGKKGKRIPNDKTTDEYVYGYTIYNDVTDYGREMDHDQFDMKIFDTFCPMGPSIVTKDEVEDLYNVTKRVWVSGHLAGERSTREMLHLVTEFVSAASQTLTLLPGTVIGTGAPYSGRIKPGDILEIEITKLGRLKNPVVSEK